MISTKSINPKCIKTGIGYGRYFQRYFRYLLAVVMQSVTQKYVLVIFVVLLRYLGFHVLTPLCINPYFSRIRCRKRRGSRFRLLSVISVVSSFWCWRLDLEPVLLSFLCWKRTLRSWLLVVTILQLRMRFCRKDLDLILT